MKYVIFGFIVILLLLVGLQVNSWPRSYEVIKVVDWDTIKLEQNGKTETVRLIGVDTPEKHKTKKSNYTVECYGVEASNYVENLLLGEQVFLISDVTQGDYDRYWRRLGYITYSGVDLGENLIYNGYAREYTYNINYTKRDTYTLAQKVAEENKLGLWGNCLD